MNNEKQQTESSEIPGFVDVERLREALFPDPKSRPCAETIERAAQRRAIPSAKIGRLRFYSVQAVREALLAKASQKNPLR
jgi:hypothetical protein